MPSRDRDEGDGLGVVADLLDETGSLLDDFVEPVLGPFGSVHFVASDDELSDTEGEGEEGVLSGLSVLGDTGLEFTGTGSDDEDSAVSLGSTGDHVLDKVSVAGSVNDGDHVFGGLELPQGDVNGDTSLSLGLQFVQHPCVLEGSYDDTSESCPTSTSSTSVYSHFPSSAASFSNFSMVRLSIPPHL